MPPVLSDATTYGAHLRRVAVALCALTFIAHSLPASANPLASSRYTYRTKSGKPIRIKGTLRYDAATAPPAISASTETSVVPSGPIDHDLYIRNIPGAPGLPDTTSGGAWSDYMHHLLSDVHALIERDLTIPGYADVIVTVESDGSCTGRLDNVMGGPAFQQRAQAFLDDLNTNRTLRFPADGRRSLSFIIGAGMFHRSSNPKDGHFWCGGTGEISYAAAQLKKRYSQYHE